MFEKYDAYKDSDNAELPNVPRGWKVDRIKYEIQLLTGYPFNSSKYSEDGIKLVRGINVKESVLDWKDTAYWPEATPDLQRYLLKDGDLLIGMDGSKVGKNFCQVSAQDLPLLLLQRVARLRVKNLLNARYLYWNLASKRFLNWINKSKTDPMIPHMAPKDINDFVIAFPPVGEQEGIALFLDNKTSEIDQAIAIKKQQIALLNERKQIVIQKAVIQGLDPNMPMKDSDIDGIGKIPKHWETFFNRRLFRENSRPVKGDELPLSLSQKDGVIPSSEMKEKSLSPAHRNNFKLCFPNDLVVNRFKGHLGVFFQSNYIGIVTFHYGVFEPAKNVYTKYFELLYHTEQYKTLYAGASNGMSIGLQNLSNLNFYRIKSIVPPLEEQKMICDYADKVEKEHSNLIQKLEIQIEKLKEYKTTLINDAVTGKIKVA